MDPPGDRLHAYHRVIGLRRRGVLHPVEYFLSAAGGWSPRCFMLLSNLVLGRSVSIQLSCRYPALQSGPPWPGCGALRGFQTQMIWRGRISATVREKTVSSGERGGQRGGRRGRTRSSGIVVAKLGADLEEDELGGVVVEEAAELGEDVVDEVGGEDSVADTAVLLDADVEDADANGELGVDGAGLALGEGAGDERDADAVGGGVVGPGPHDVGEAELIERTEGGHPTGTVGGWKSEQGKESPEDDRRSERIFFSAAMVFRRSTCFDSWEPMASCGGE
ncbi:hypothetical protein HPP92_008844 [Vanilla planifolia]|uniref:Uncharacterized protein n=1 Tax=Vanilla planifolia TaxID=51239 RepID=A0A835RD55_VANPL|nr:hypothetical protein HPP92_008844 [Vanilla planifolia]